MRALRRLDEIYAIGQHRAGYSPEEDAAHELAAGWLREAGLEVSRDAAGNLFGTRGAARVWAGSHLDSVPTAGKFDGALGVVAAIEAAERLPEAPLAVAVFRAEETGPMGSKAIESSPDAYLEVHIEQGPVLASLGEPLGVVTAIAGQARGHGYSRGAQTTQARRRWPIVRMHSSRRPASSCTCASRSCGHRRHGRRAPRRTERGQRRAGAGDGVRRREVGGRRPAR